ncbi:MAG: F0F1 ATP synthase subunit B [Rariglobus sp.]|nr:F0F1 ATP synthase subunit B [Rariglobus sp.]
MLSLLLAAANPAVETAHDAHAAGAQDDLLHGLVTKFGIDGFSVGMQLFSFALLAVVLYKFAIKPVLATMDERNAKIDAGLKNAEATTAQLAQAQATAAAQLKEAQVAANKIIEEARKTAKDLSDREAAASTERAAHQLAKAQQSIALEHKKMLDEARTEIARLVVATTERVLAKKLTDSDRAAYNEAAARELTTV